MNPDSPEYIEQYHRLVDTLCRSFSKTQILRFARIYALQGVNTKTKKIEMAEAIIERKWGWPNLLEVEKAKRDRTEVVTEAFPVTPSQLFLILGRDGADLLQLSRQFNVHISLDRNPLSLRIEGLRGRSQNLVQKLRSLTKDMVEDTFQMPIRTPIRPDLIQRISRLAGAYIENVGQHGVIRICAKDVRSVASAKRLASRATGEVVSTSSVPLVSYLPAGTPLSDDNDTSVNYALYPFLSTRALPWFMNTAGAFRVRRVGDWLYSSQREQIERTGGLSGERGQLYFSKNPIAWRDNLRNTLLYDSKPSDEVDTGRRITVKASTGHILFTTSSTEQHAALRPPLEGPHQFSDVLSWIKTDNARASFVSSLPPRLVHSPPAQQRIVHRLIYKVPPSSPKPKTELISFEVVLAQSKGELADDDSAPALELKPQYRKGLELVTDMMMPDRPMDLRMTVVEDESIPDGLEPPELREYTMNIRDFMSGSSQHAEQPDPPLMMTYDGTMYILHTSATIRQSLESLSPSDSRTSAQTVVSESILDLESGYRSTGCELVCSDPTSDALWTEFMTGCDALTSAPRPSSAALPSMDTIEV